MEGPAQSFVRFQGSVNVSSEFYGASRGAGRRPDNEQRAVITSTLSLSDYVSIPFELYRTSRQATFQQPFNQFGASPTFFGWLTLHGGYFSTRLSDLTFGDTRLLGGGVDLRPGSFRISFLYGRMRAPLNPDTANSFFGTYERKALGFKVGYGKEDATFVDVNVVRVFDDSSSISFSPVPLPAVENLVASLAFGFPIAGDVVRVKGEAAVSAFTNDLRAQEKSVNIGPLKSLFTARHSSQFDGAATLGMMIRPSSTFQLGLNGKWIGPGYTSLGYAQLQNDVFETNVSPAFSFAERKVSVRASVGLRFNNLRNNRFATTNRVMTSISTTVQPSSSFGVDLQYANHSMNSKPKNDTLKIDNTLNSFSISPRYIFEGLGGNNTAILSYYFQQFSDNNVLAAAFSKSQTNTITGIWTLMLPSTLSFTTTATHVSSKLASTSTITSLNETVGQSFFDGKLSLSGGGTYSRISAFSKDKQFAGRLNASYSLDQAGMFTLSISTNAYNFGAAAGQPNFTESQAVLQYGLSF